MRIQIPLKTWQAALDEAGKSVPLYDLPYAFREYAKRYLS